MDKLNIEFKSKLINNKELSNANSNKSRNIDTIVNDLFVNQKKDLWISLLEEKLNKPLFIQKLLKENKIYIHDSENLHLPYCNSFDFSRLLFEENNFGNLVSKKCNSVQSYISTLTDCIHHFSNYLAGAIGVGTIFKDIAFLIHYREKKDINSPETKKYLQNLFQQFIHSVNHATRGGETPFTNISVFDYQILEGVVNNNELLDITYKVQKIFLEFYNDGINGLPYTFPIVTINLSSIENNCFLDYVIEKLDYNKYNFFLSKDAKFAMCCRLQNNQELMENLGKSSNSFAASPANIGSHRVITINFYNLAKRAKSINDFENLIKKTFEDCVEILNVQKEFIYELKEYNPLLKNNWINMSRLFSTIGIIGLVEARDLFNISGDLIESVLLMLNKLAIAYSKIYNLIINLEQIPGESARFTLAERDNNIFGFNYKFYSNQFIPLTQEVGIFEKIFTEGKYYETLTGGGIAHLRIKDKLSPSILKRILGLSYNAGLGHLAISSVYSKCHNNHVFNEKIIVCPECNSKEISYFERIVGYFSNTNNWTENQRKSDFNNRKYLVI